MDKYLVIIVVFVAASCGGGGNSVSQIPNIADAYDAFVGLALFVTF